MENYRYGDSIPPPRPLGKGWKYRKVQRKACGGEKAVARRGRMWYNEGKKYDAGGAGYGIAVV
jgi:hypothetical protein